MHTPRRIHAHTDWALHVALCASGANVLSTGLDATYLNGKALDLAARAKQCALTMDGSRAAVALNDGTVRIFDAASREELESHHGALPEACGVALAGAVTAACFTSGTEHRVVVRAHGAQHSAEFDGIGRGVALDAHGTRLAFAATKNRVAVTDVELGPGVTLLAADALGDVGLSLDAFGVEVAIADAAALRIMDIRAKERDCIALQGYRAPGKYGRCSLSKDGTRVIAAQSDGFAVWDLRSTTKIASLRTGVAGFNNGCSITHSGEAAVTAATDGAVRLWSLVSNVGRFLRARETTEDVRWWSKSCGARRTTRCT